MGGGGGSSPGLRRDVVVGCPGWWSVGGEGVIGKLRTLLRNLEGWRPQFEKCFAGGGADVANFADFGLLNV